MLWFVVFVRHPPFKTFVDVCPGRWSEGKSEKHQHKWLAPRMTWNVEELETPSASVLWLDIRHNFYIKVISVWAQYECMTSLCSLIWQKSYPWLVEKYNNKTTTQDNTCKLSDHVLFGRVPVVPQIIQLTNSNCVVVWGLKGTLLRRLNFSCA